MSRNPMLEGFVRRAKTSPAYKHSRKQEQNTAKITGGRQIPASGAGWRKGDVEVPNIARIECKATQHDSFRVTKEMLRKIEDACGLDGQYPIIEVEFVDISGNQLGSLCVVRREDLYSLIGRLKDAESTGNGQGEATPAARPAKRPLKPVIRRRGSHG